MSHCSRKVFAAALFCLALAASAGAQVASAAIDLHAYIADLQNWSAGVAQLAVHPEQVSALRHSVPLKLEVQSNGQHFLISNAWLVMALAHWEKQPPQRQVLQQAMALRLQWELQQVMALNRPAEGPAPQAARAQLAAVLKGREFRFVRPPSWWDLMMARARRWVLHFLDRLMRRLHLKPAVGNVLSWVLLGLAFVLVAWMLWRNLRRASRGMLGLGLEAPASTAWGWRQWADAARAAAAEQRYRDAVHCCYWAAVFRLEQMGAWRRDDSRTPREYLRLLPRGSEHRQAMSNLTRDFEMVWYGYRPVTAAEAESAVREMENLGCSSPSRAATASF